jgi:hypothetical protein
VNGSSESCHFRTNAPQQDAFSIWMFCPIARDRVRNFLAYEANRETAIELVRKRVPVSEGELAEAVAEVSGNEFVGPGMRPGDVRRLGRKSDFDEV